MSDQPMSKSARRRRRRKGGQIVQNVQNVQNDDTGPAEIEGPTSDGARTMTIALPKRHWETWDWLCGGLGLDQQSQFASQVLRAEIIRRMPEYREAMGGGGKTVRGKLDLGQ